MQIFSSLLRWSSLIACAVAASHAPAPAAPAAGVPRGVVQQASAATTPIVPTNSSYWSDFKIEQAAVGPASSRSAVRVSVSGRLWNRVNTKAELNQLYLAIRGSHGLEVLDLIKPTVHPGAAPGRAFSWQGDVDLHIPPGDRNLDVLVVLQAAYDDDSGRSATELDGGGLEAVIGTVVMH